MRYDTKMRGEFTPDFPVMKKNLMLNGFIWENDGKVNIEWFQGLLKERESEAAQDLIDLFSKRGMDSLCDVDGAFLLALYDQYRGRGYLYRSLLCKTSLYYRFDNGKLKWSMNPVDLLNNNILDHIQTELLLVACFNNNPPNNESFFQDVYRLPPGYSLTYMNGDIKIEQIEKLEVKKGNQYRSIWSYVEEANELVDKTFKRRFTSNDTVAVQLSGGIDSASVLSRLKHIGVPVIAFHWSFKGIDAGDETSDARLITEYLDVPLKEIEVSTVLKHKNYIDQNWKFFTPYGHSFYKLFELTAQKIKEYNIDTVTNGHFGDHIFGPLPDISMNNHLRTIPIRERFKYWFESIGTDRSSPALEKEWEEISPKMFLYKDILTNKSIELARSKSELLRFPKNMKEAFLEILNHETESSLQSNLFEKNIHMMYPLASRELIEFALRIPYAYRNIPTGGIWVDKPILRLMNMGRLPSKIVSKNYNYNMGALDEQYVIQNIGQVKLLLEDSFLTQYKIIDPDKLRKALENKKMAAKLATSLISCCMVEIWLRSLHRIDVKKLTKEEQHV
ncbi:asparagine synthase-related protein [Bacillus sonorensis]|uniref:asparagine synthase-related protein n=1 Tax=Bacillus sonorensis TaxID=119858 RepID=UPI0022831762|nr:asparagine synthetase B family protein [Bacillus sonorensis]MCY8026467.1 asparagine synthase-related protein [Bacillus sonorensis]